MSATFILVLVRDQPYLLNSGKIAGYLYCRNEATIFVECAT